MHSAHHHRHAARAQVCRNLVRARRGGRQAGEAHQVGLEIARNLFDHFIGNTNVPVRRRERRHISQPQRLHRRQPGHTQPLAPGLGESRINQQ